MTVSKKRKILIWVMAIIAPLVAVYAVWALLFFPDDFSITRREARETAPAGQSRTVDVAFVDRVGTAGLHGDFSGKAIESLVKSIREKEGLIKNDALVRGRNRDLVFRAGTGLPGIWVDERSSLIIPKQAGISFPVTVKKNSVLEFSALSMCGDGALTLEIISNGVVKSSTRFDLPRYRQALTARDARLHLNNRSYSRARDDLGWREYSLDLSSWEGKDITVRFSYSSGEGTAFIGNPKIFVANDARRYNVIYIVFDGVSTRHWSFYNPDSNLTPFMREKAEQEFIVLDNLFTLGDKTRISTSGLFCSVFPFLTRHGINRNFIPAEEIDRFYEAVRSGRLAALPDVFRRNGYISEQFGNSGFTVQMLSTGVDYGFERSYEFSFNPYDSYGIAHRFFNFLRKNREREFFTYLHFNTPHKPFFAPIHHYFKGIINSPLASLWRPDFMGCLSYTDDVFKNLYEALRAQGLLENSIIVVATDHGAGFDLSKFDSGFQYADYTRMTFMIRLPDELKKRHGISQKRIPTWLSSINNAPTLCDLAGVPVPKAFHGRSFVPVLAGRHKDNYFDREIWSFGRKELSVIQEGRYKYILNHNEAARYVNRKYAAFGEEREVPYEQIYDLKNDPLEKVNLIGQRHDLLKRFRTLFLEADIHHPERTILTLVPDDDTEHHVNVAISSPSAMMSGELYAEDLSSLPVSKVAKNGNSVKIAFNVKKNPVYLVVEHENDRAPLTVHFSDNGRSVPETNIFTTYLNLNLYANPVIIANRTDFISLNEFSLPDARELKKPGRNGLSVKVSRMDLHRWIDIDKLEQKGISAGMKETLKSWGYIQ